MKTFKMFVKCLRSFCVCSRSLFLVHSQYNKELHLFDAYRLFFAFNTFLVLYFYVFLRNISGKLSVVKCHIMQYQTKNRMVRNLIVLIQPYAVLRCLNYLFHNSKSTFDGFTRVACDAVPKRLNGVQPLSEFGCTLHHIDQQHEVRIAHKVRANWNIRDVQVRNSISEPCTLFNIRLKCALIYTSRVAQTTRPSNFCIQYPTICSSYCEYANAWIASVATLFVLLVI